MSRRISAQFNAPVVIQLKESLVKVATFFVESIGPHIPGGYDERRQVVMDALQLTGDQLDELDCYLTADYYDLKLVGHRLIVSPDEDSWSEMPNSDLACLVKFIQRFAENPQFPILLTSVTIESSTTSQYGEEITSEYSVLTPTELRVYIQNSTTGSGTGLRSDPPMPPEGIMTRMLLPADDSQVPVPDTRYKLE